MPGLHEIGPVLERAKGAAVDYYQLTGKPLGITGERPLRLNFQTTSERIQRLWQETAFQNLATSKKRKNDAVRQVEIASDIRSLESDILRMLKKVGVS